MRLEAQNLATDGLRFETDGPDAAANRLVLGASDGISGTYAQDPEAIALEPIKARQFHITELSWGLSAGRISSEGESLLQDAEVNARIPRQSAKDEPGFLGTIAAAKLEIPSLHLRRGELTVRVDSLVLENLLIRVDGAGTHVEASRLRAGAVQVESSSFEARATELELPQGLALNGGEVRLPNLEVTDLTVELPDLSALRSSDDQPRAADRPTGNPSKQGDRQNSPQNGSSQSPLGVLDALAGRFHVDLKVDATLPLLGRRRATHRFRVPVHQGAIDFHDLEHDLSSLEDAVLDFRVRDGKLCLERDLSMMRFWSKVLVYWEFEEPDEQKLAKQNRVRLRRLAAPQVPKPRKEEEVEKGTKGAVVRQLDFNNVDVALSLARSSVPLSNGAQLRLGTDERQACDSLKITGDVCYEPGRSIDPTKLDISASKLHFGIDQLPAGQRTLDIRGADIDAIRDVAIHLDGIQPTSLAAAVNGIHLQQITLKNSE